MFILLTLVCVWSFWKDWKEDKEYEIEAARRARRIAEMEALFGKPGHPTPNADEMYRLHGHKYKLKLEE